MINVTCFLRKSVTKQIFADRRPGRVPIVGGDRRADAAEKRFSRKKLGLKKGKLKNKVLEILLRVSCECKIHPTTDHRKYRLGILHVLNRRPWARKPYRRSNFFC
ncbi:hypothetical protein Zmor_021440 [Zophobas morio]|uniref:Uncharacterized protein n=1 Tax=Zophobas morio TaxID=2755281 RepID=A0AA38MAH1_9CUCU|nr:hypothetical protein Zmor_021440 [Zophobas morio]